jgi:hypothetical protein
VIHPALLGLIIASGVLTTEPWPMDISGFLPKPRSKTYKQSKRRVRRLGFRR